jgi:phage shock protein C
MSYWSRWHWFSGPDRLYRDPENGIISGICAGLAEYFGVKIVLVRAAALLSLCFFIFPVFIAYIVLSFVLPRRPRSAFAGSDRRADRDERRADRYARRRERRQERWERRYGSAGSASFAADMPPPTGDSLRTLLDKFGALEDRLARMETEVTSADFDLKRKFRDIGG